MRMKLHFKQQRSPLPTIFQKSQVSLLSSEWFQNLSNEFLSLELKFQNFPLRFNSDEIAF